MRHVTLSVFLAVASLGVGTAAHATPFEPATMPDQVQAVGHVDVDALRKTQLFAAAGGQAAIDAGIDEAPAELQSLAHALVRSARGVSFWHDGAHGSIYIETRDAQALAQLVPKLPLKPAATVEGRATYTVEKDGKTHYCAVFGDTLVLADSDESLARSIHVLAGKAANLAGSNKLPVTSRQGVFVFVTLGEDLLGSIQKSAHSQMLQLGLRSAVVDVSESAGMVTASARAEMSSAETLQKAKGMLDGLQTMASLSDEPMARTLLDGLSVTTSGLALVVAEKLPVAEVVKVLHNHHHHK